MSSFSKLVVNEETLDENCLDENSSEYNCKKQYKELKKKFKHLVYEREILEQTRNMSQLQLLKAKQQRYSLLDKLVEFENITLSSSDDELTESSDEDSSIKPKPKKEKKQPAKNSSSGTSKHSVKPKKVRKIAKKPKPSPQKSSKKLQSINISGSNSVLSMAENKKKKALAEPKSGINNFSQHVLVTDDEISSEKSIPNTMIDLDKSPIYIDEEMIDVEIIE